MSLAQGAPAVEKRPRPSPESGRRPRSARAKEDRRVGYLLITPTFIIVFVMVVLPILWTFSLAFQDVRLLNLRNTGLIGEYSLDNFRSVITDSGFVQALTVTLTYSVLGTAGAIGAFLEKRQPSWQGR